MDYNAGYELADLVSHLDGGQLLSLLLLDIYSWLQDKLPVIDI